MRVRALQDEDVLYRALEALDRIAAEARDTALRNLGLRTAAEVRPLHGAGSDDNRPEEPQPAGFLQPIPRCTGLTQRPQPKRVVSAGMLRSDVRAHRRVVRCPRTRWMGAVRSESRSLDGALVVDEHLPPDAIA
jgi:hypothetical protein